MLLIAYLIKRVNSISGIAYKKDDGDLIDNGNFIQVEAKTHC